MPASDEIRRAAANLRKAAQLKRDELRALQTQLGKSKDDGQRLVLVMKNEQNSIQQMQNIEQDPNAQTQLQVRMGDLNNQISMLQDNNQKEISALEQQIRDTEQAISQFEQQAVDLERQAGQV